MITHSFSGFAGVEIAADIYGDENHPCVVLLPGATQSRRVWEEGAKALANAGRYVVSLDLRGHGKSGRPSDGNYSLDAFVADLRAVLAQLSSRPVIVGSTFGGWIALTALGESEVPLATGVVLASPPIELSQENAERLSEAVSNQQAKDPKSFEYDAGFLESSFDFEQLEQRLEAAAHKLKVPTLIVSGTSSEVKPKRSKSALEDLIPHAELAAIEGADHYVAFNAADEFHGVLLEFLERNAPRDAPEYIAGSDPRTLRDALGCFSTGITVVTTRNPEGAPVGLTANSFSSVSLDPPLVLVCLAKTAGSLNAFQKAHSFAVNILHIGQQPISNLFASKGRDRFAETAWSCWDRDVPILDDCLASFECQKSAEIEQGDHVILIGEVARAKFEPRRDPLLYFAGKYRRLHFN